MIFLIAGLVVLALGAVVLVTLAFQLMQQSGRILERVEILEKVVTEGILDGGGGLPRDLPGLPVGAIAPEFELRDLSGDLRHSGEWRGFRLLLVFVDPLSPHCRRLAEYLQHLGTDVAAGRPKPVFISIGDAETNRQAFGELHGQVTVLLQTATSDISAAYQIDATPAAYTISQDGLIDSPLAYGLQAVLIEAGQLEGASRFSPHDHERGHLPGSDPQEGLEPGSQAPLFRLPRVGGGEVSLLEYRGKNTLLVFSDPECEPCVDMLPSLAKLSETRPDLSVVMVSRGTEAENAPHLEQSGVSFAVGLQRDWEVSHDYLYVATPVGYLLDEWGMTVGEVGIGSDGVLELAKLPDD